MIIQLCKSLSANVDFVQFIDNFFINARLFKVLGTMSIEICETIKVERGFFSELAIIRAAVTKQKDWDKMSLMIVRTDKKWNLDNENVLCMIWVDLNIVQYMTITHIVDEMKTINWKMKNVDTKFQNRWSQMKKSHFRSQSLNITAIWEDRTKMLSNDYTTPLMTSIVAIDDRFSYFFSIRSFWMHSNYENVFILSQSSFIQNFSIRSSSLY